MQEKTKKIRINYTMLKGEKTKDASIVLPISEQRYNMLAKGLQPDNTVWLEIKDALTSLVILQGYDKLGKWGVTLKILV